MEPWLLCYSFFTKGLYAINRVLVEKNAYVLEVERVAVEFKIPNQTILNAHSVHINFWIKIWAALAKQLIIDITIDV